MEKPWAEIEHEYITTNIGQRALYGPMSDIGIALNYALFALINEGVDYGTENLR